MNTLDRIISLVESKSITEKQFLEDLGLNRSLLSDWKSGKSQSYVKHIRKIADYFNVPLSFLMEEQPFQFWQEINDYRVALFEQVSLFKDSNNFSTLMKEIIDLDIITFVKFIDSVFEVINYARDNENSPEFEVVLKPWLNSNNNTMMKELFFINQGKSELYNYLNAYLDKISGNEIYQIHINDLKDTNTKESGDRWLKKNATPISSFIHFPIVGRVAAGAGVIAQDEILGYEFVDGSKVQKGENYFWLLVKGDSMSPKIEDGDLVLVRQQKSVDSGDFAVVTVDEEDGVVKKVKYDKEWIELVSINPYYPVRKFEHEDVLRISVVGKVLEVRRTL